MNNNGRPNQPPYLISAYGIWLRQGNSGTEEDFINSLKGDPGDKPLLRFDAESGYLQDRYDETSEWENLASLEALMTEGEAAVIAAAKEYSDLAEAYAKGTVDGDDVPSGDPGYHDNAKYYAGQAQTSAGAAGDSADAAAASAADAAESTEAAGAYSYTASQHAAGAAQYASTAASMASNASTSAGSSATSAQAAADSASGAATSAYNADQAAQSAANYASAANSALGTILAVENAVEDTAANVSAYVTAAAAAQTAAEAAQTAAETAETNAETAQGKAEDAQEAAETAQAAAEAVLESIPEDYSELSSDVTDLKSAINAVAPEMTLFLTKANGQYCDTTITQIDPNAQTYSGYTFAENGTFSASAVYNTYAFKVPYDNFTFYSNGARICIAEGYPDTSSETISIKTSIVYGAGDISVLRTAASKGDIVVISIGTSYTHILLTKVPTAVNFPNLEVSPTFDLFRRYADIDDSNTDIGNAKLNITRVVNALLATTTAGYSTSTSYDSWYFRVPTPSMSITCTNGFRAAIANQEPSTTSQQANLKRLIYSSSSERVDTFTAYYGEWVIITVAHSAGDIVLRTDYINRISIPSLRLGYLQSNSFYRYETSGTVRRLYIYYKSGGKYVRWALHNAPGVSSNSNTWQIAAVYGLDEDLTNPVEIVSGGEFELAFKEYGAADYCGGNNHGDENTIDFSLFIDGKQIDLTTLDNNYHAFNRIDAIEHAYINRCDTPGDNILKHQKIWTFEHGVIKVRQTLEFLEELQCDFLCCMFAANRSYFTHGVRQGAVGIEDISTSSFERKRTDANEMMYLMYGADVTAKISAKTCDHSPTASLWINGASTINKLYYNFYGQIPNTTVASGTVVTWESDYDVAFN